MPSVCKKTAWKKMIPKLDIHIFGIAMCIEDITF